MREDADTISGSWHGGISIIEVAVHAQGRSMWTDMIMNATWQG